VTDQGGGRGRGGRRSGRRRIKGEGLFKGDEVNEEDYERDRMTPVQKMKTSAGHVAEEGDRRQQFIGDGEVPDFSKLRIFFGVVMRSVAAEGHTADLLSSMIYLVDYEGSVLGVHSNVVVTIIIQIHLAALCSSAALSSLTYFSLKKQSLSFECSASMFALLDSHRHRDRRMYL